MAKQTVAGIDYHDPRVTPAALAMMEAKDPLFADRIRHVLAAADEADQAAGIQRVKQRTITTVEEFEELPIGSVIVDRDSDAWQRYSTGWTCADRSMNTVGQPSASLTNILGPATVLLDPSA